MEAEHELATGVRLPVRSRWNVIGHHHDKVKASKRVDIWSIWNSSKAEVWEEALGFYWEMIPEGRMPLERRMEDLSVDEVGAMDARSWFAFLHNEYFPWKYTQANRLASSQKQLQGQLQREGLAALDAIRTRLLGITQNEIARPIHIVLRIAGLGAAGGTGLLAVMYPDHFGTVDRFVVENLRIAMPDALEFSEMNPGSLTGLDAVLLIQTMRDKAAELTDILERRWTPRMVDQVLWASRANGE